MAGPVGVDVQVDASKVLEELRRVGVALTPIAALKAISLEQLQWIDKNFRAQGLEKRWKPLRPATLKRRRKGPGSGSGQILQDTGRLKGSFVLGGPDGVHRVTPLEAEVGTNVEYADYHEQERSKPRHIPQRKMLPSVSLAEQLAINLLEARLDRALNGGQIG